MLSISLFSTFEGCLLVMGKAVGIVIRMILCDVTFSVGAGVDLAVLETNASSPIAATEASCRAKKEYQRRHGADILIRKKMFSWFSWFCNVALTKYTNILQLQFCTERT